MARPCLALLRNLKHSHIVADKSVRNFDMESYHRGLMSSVISTIHPNPPLSLLAPFRCYGSAKQTSLFCSRLNRNVDKGGFALSRKRDSPRIGADTQLQTNKEAIGEGARCLCILLFHRLRLLDHRIIDRTKPCFSGRRLDVD
mgnify:CR=1 FL=1